jgi:small conductance mechanosensitive channel
LLAAWAVALALSFGLAAGAAQAQAQAEPAGPGEAVTVDELEALVSTLEDEAEREKLAAQIRALIAAKRAAAEAEGEGPRAGTIGALSQRIDDLSREVVAAAAAVVDAPQLVRWVGRQMADPDARGRLLWALVKLVAVLAAGLVADRAAGMAVARPRRAIESREVESAPVRWALLVSHAALSLIPIAAFAAAAYAVLPLTDPGPATRAVALALVNAIVLARAVMALAAMMFAPRFAALRAIPVSDESAHYAYLWVARLANTAVYGYFAAAAALLLGLPAGGHTTLLNLLGLAIAAMLVVLILQNRAVVADWIRGPEGAAPEERRVGLGGLRRLLAEVWHVLAILYVVGIFIIWALNIEEGFRIVVTGTALTLVIVIAARLVVAGAGRVIRRGFSVSEDLKARFPTLEARANRYVPILDGALKVVVYGVALFALLQVWGIDAMVWLESETGGRLMGAAVSIVLVLVAALVLWEVISLFIESWLSRVEAGEMSAERGARFRTVLPLLRNALLVVLGVLVSLIVLSELGINIAPLLAGAGVVGLAIGFGSQKLVQDVITGVFILIEDTVAVGDVVTLDGHGGLVEAMSIRTIRLRDLEGNVHTVPFSQVGTVLNRTKEFSYYLMDVGVAYREDVDEVIAVLRQLLEELREDATYGPNILEPLEVLGVDRFDDSAVIVRARIKTLPIKQWFVGREFNRRMKKRFDELGIEIPFPHRTLYFGVDKEGLAPPVRVQREDAHKAGTAAPAPPKPKAPRARRAEAEDVAEAGSGSPGGEAEDG